VLDIDSTIKPLYGQQEGAVVGYNPHKPGRPSHCYHTYMPRRMSVAPVADQTRTPDGGAIIRAAL
jgi:hypothetical protein